MRAPSLFEGALAASFVLHAAVWQSARWLLPGGSRPAEKIVELDMTQPFRLTSNPLFQSIGGRSALPRPRGPREEAAKQEPPETVDDVSSARPPAPADELSDTQADGRAHAGAGLQGGAPAALPGGAGDGEGGRGRWLHLTRLPRLADKAAMERALRRYYPEEERKLGHEADVTLHLHIDVKGRVSVFEVVRSGGPAFDEAAGKVVRELEFVPALAGQLPAAVKVRQTISFRLKD